jgi:hypothetical protein
MTAAEQERLEREILTVRLALAGELPPPRRALLTAELEDLRLARLGCAPPASVLGSTCSAPAPPAETRGCYGVAQPWGEATRVHLS